MVEAMADYHLRLENSREQMDNAIKHLKDISGCVAIWHMRGKKGEHPHLHVWYPLDKCITNEAFLDRLKRLENFKNFKGNKQWSTRRHNDFKVWLEYVLRGNKGQQIEVWNRPEPPPEIIPIVADPTAIIIINKDISKKLPMRQKFIQYLENEGFKRGSTFTPESYERHTDILDTVSDKMTEFWDNAFTLPEGERMLRHAMYVFSDDVVKEQFKKLNRDNYRKKIFG